MMGYHVNPLTCDIVVNNYSNIKRIQETSNLTILIELFN